MEFESLSYIDTSANAQWTLKGPFSLDLLLGLLAAGCMLFKIIHPGYPTYMFDVSIRSRGELASILFEDLNEYDYYPDPPKNEEILFEDYVGWINQTERNVRETMNKYLTKGRNFHPKANYGIWIPSIVNSERWDLISFDNPQEFMQGFISMCNAFQIDFRNYILGPPYDRNGIEYDIVGYHIQPYFTAKKNKIL